MRDAIIVGFFRDLRHSALVAFQARAKQISEPGHQKVSRKSFIEKLLHAIQAGF
jgi:hypothetical protein